MECKYVGSAPLDSRAFMPAGTAESDGDPSLVPFVHQDDDDNVYFDVYTVRGEDNKIMYANNGVLVVSIGPTTEIQNTVEHNLWTFIATILEVDTSEIEVLLFPGEIVRRVLLKNKILSAEDCKNKIEEYLQPYVLHSPRTPAEALLNPHAPLAVYAQNDTGTDDGGDWKYYEMDLEKHNKKIKSDKKSENLIKKKLLEMKPFYGKDPSLMAKILRDLGVRNEVVFRGRLLPGSPVKPILDDYRGKGKVKLVRRVLEGFADGSGHKNSEAKMRLQMSHPVPDHMMLDYLSPDKRHVVSRRVVNPLYRNVTVDLVEELEYTEVV